MAYIIEAAHDRVIVVDTKFNSIEIAIMDKAGKGLATALIEASDAEVLIAALSVKAKEVNKKK